MNLWQLLDNPLIWEFSRFGLDFSFGLYRKRIRAMREWRLLESKPSIIDIGCGIGRYANITEGKYLGIDLNQRYIDYAYKKHRCPNQSFRCADVMTVLSGQSTFNLALIVDFLHHLSDEQCARVLNAASHLAEQYVVSFEPITYQPNPIGRWIVEHDRGTYVRPLEELHRLFRESGLVMMASIELRLGPIDTRAILAHPPGSDGRGDSSDEKDG